MDAWHDTTHDLCSHDALRALYPRLSAQLQRPRWTKSATTSTDLPALH